MLHIVGRRQDGYHELQTVFQLIDLCDRVDITVRMDGLISRPSGPPGVPEAQDLVVRAAKALQSVSGTRLGADISVRKRIPMGGGLGGGSSDAATTLLALNQMWKTGYSRAQIADFGLALEQMSRFSCTEPPPGLKAWASGSRRSRFRETRGTW